MSALITLCKFSHFCEAEDSNKQIAASILRNLQNMREATLQDVADFCFVSVATVSRFIRNAGYASFAQFRQAVSRELDAYRYVPMANVLAFADVTETMDSFIQQSVAMAKQLRDEIDRDLFIEIADAMHGKQNIYVYTFFFQSSLPYLQVDLSLMGKRVEICEVEVDQNRTIGEIGPDSYLLVIKRQDADTHYMDKLIRQAKQQGAEIGIIIDSPNATILDCADQTLVFAGTNSAVDSVMMNNCVSLLSIAYRKRYLTT